MSENTPEDPQRNKITRDTIADTLKSAKELSQPIPKSPINLSQPLLNHTPHEVELELLGRQFLKNYRPDPDGLRAAAEQELIRLAVEQHTSPKDPFLPDEYINMILESPLQPKPIAAKTASPTALPLDVLEKPLPIKD